MVAPSAFTGIFVPLADIFIAGLILAGFWAAMGRAGIAPGERRRKFAFAAALIGAWYLLVTAIAARGMLQAAPDVRFPGLPVAVFAPILIGLAYLTRSSFIGRLHDATPLSHLIAVQITRLLGAIFIFEWARGALPGVFAIPAGLGDMSVALLAIPTALLAARGSTLAPVAVGAWTVLGLGDFVSALATGFLSSPGQFQQLSLHAPNLYASAYPLAMIPAFGVPLLVMLHAITLRKLARMSTASTRGAQQQAMAA